MLVNYDTSYPCSIMPEKHSYLLQLQYSHGKDTTDPSN